MQGAVDSVHRRFGRIDYAVNCAGLFALPFSEHSAKLTVVGMMGDMKSSHELTTKEFDDIMNTNARGLWLASRTELSLMLGQEPLPTHDGRPGNRGAIVNVGSNLALVSRPGARMPPSHVSLPLKSISL